jgi:hypothetical protein
VVVAAGLEGVRSLRNTKISVNLTLGNHRKRQGEGHSHHGSIRSPPRPSSADLFSLSQPPHMQSHTPRCEQDRRCKGRLSCGCYVVLCSSLIIRWYTRRDVLGGFLSVSSTALVGRIIIQDLAGTPGVGRRRSQSHRFHRVSFIPVLFLFRSLMSMSLRETCIN